MIEGERERLRTIEDGFRDVGSKECKGKLIADPGAIDVFEAGKIGDGLYLPGLYSGRTREAR